MGSRRDVALEREWMITVEYETDGKFKVSSEFAELEKAEKYADEIRKLRLYAGRKFVIRESGKVVKEYPA